MTATTSTSAVSGNLIVPVVLWGRKAPSHRIRALAVLPDNKTVLSGTCDGQICIWTKEINSKEIVPKYMLFGHGAPISCIAPAGIDPSTTKFVSSSKNGVTCLWESQDGRCVDSVQSSHVHTYIRPHVLSYPSGAKMCRLFCVGHYSEIVVMEPQSLQTLFTLSSRVEPDWVTTFTILSPSPKTDICIGLSNAGMVKIWSLSELDQRDMSNPIYEDESKQIRCQGGLSLTACSSNPRTMLVVSPHVWQVFDASDFSMLLNQMSPNNEHLLGGTFVALDKIAVWCSDGNAYFYQLPRTASFGGKGPALESPFDKTTLYCVTNVSGDVGKTLSWEPVFCVWNVENKLCLLRGDSYGTVSMWDVPEIPDKSIIRLNQESFKGYPTLKPSVSDSLDEIWKRYTQPAGIVDHLGEHVSITTTLYVASQGRLILGTKEGGILLVAGTKTLKKEFFNVESAVPDVRVLKGHNGAVTVLLYPFEEHPRYDPAHLISGGVDFSVCVWDLNSGSRVFKFSVQAGPITKLFVPPANCNNRILQCVCSVAADHSVGLLSLKEQKCVLLASRHLYPVKQIKWRPLDDFLLVQCDDLTVYVWQMETGHLDRIINGLIAEDILAACDDQIGQEGEGEAEAGASQAVQMLRAIKHRNVHAMKKIAGAEGGGGLSVDPKQVPLLPPLLIQGLRAHEEDSDAHLVLFNVEALIMGLLAEEQTELSSPSSESSSIPSMDRGDASPLTGILARAKDKAEAVLRASPVPARKTYEKTERRLSGNFASETSLAMESAQILLSLLHAWNQDKDLDRVCTGKLGLLRPKDGICVGSVSRQGHLSLLLPPGVHSNEASQRFQGLDKFGVFATSVHWQLSSSITTQHLLSVIATGNTLMSMQNAGFLPEHDKKRRLVKRLSQKEQMGIPSHTQVSQATVDQLGSEQSQIKEGWSLFSALHCVLLPELVGSDFQAPRIELLARRWQERCLELREAAQALLLRELNRMGPKGRKELIDFWAPFLPTLLDPALSIFGNRLLGVRPTTGSGNGHSAAGSHYEPLLGPSDKVDPVGEKVDGSLQQVRRNQATAVVLLGVIGAEFGQEIAQCAPSGLQAPEGFSDRDYTLARATSQSLLELLLQPPTPLLPAFSPLRRAGIDLLGKGFVVWQPYLDISKVLLGLLELCANSDKLIPHGPVVFPLNPQADACRTAKHALTLIATARPPAFITALSKEVARFNQAAHSQGISHQGVSPLLRGRNEILQIIEVLTEKQYSDVVDLMIAVGEILVHCLDTSLMKNKTLGEIFPPITKFNMVSYCGNTRRIAFGGKNGSVVIHELRAGKSQTIQAHSRGCTACAFSEDGKYLASYSADEGKVNFWQASQSFLGMGQSQIRCIKQIPAPQSWPVQTPGGSPQIFKARLLWIAPKALTLLLPSGKEHRFNM